MGNRNNTFMFVAMILLGSLFFINVISAEVNMSDPLDYQRHQKILDEFDKGKEFVPISVNVFSEEQREGVISSLSDEGFRNLRRELPYSFSCEVTRSELDKLSNHLDVKWINLQEVISTQDNETIKKDTTQNDIIEREARYNWLYWLVGIVVILIIMWIISTYLVFHGKNNSKK